MDATGVVPSTPGLKDAAAAKQVALVPVPPSEPKARTPPADVFSRKSRSALAIARGKSITGNLTGETCPDLPVAGYRLRYWSIISQEDCRHSACKAVLKWLIPGNTYVFQVMAFNVSGEGDWSEASQPFIMPERPDGLGMEFEEEEQAPEPPDEGVDPRLASMKGRPAHLSKSIDAIEIAWDKPCDRGSEIETYEFMISRDPKFPKLETRQMSVDGHSEKLQLDGLIPNQVCASQMGMNVLGSIGYGPKFSSCGLARVGRCGRRVKLTHGAEIEGIRETEAHPSRQSPSPAQRGLAGTLRRRQLIHWRCLGVPGGGKVTCVSNCLVGKGVSWSCASCLGRGFNCGVNSCMGSCSTGFSKPSCTTCISSHCGLCSRARSSEGVADNATLEALVEVFAGAATAGTELEEEESSTRSGSGCFEVQALMKTCGTQCYSSSSQATCAAGCLTGKGVSPGCASCFGRKISCTIKRCLSGCAADPNGAACTSCVASKCGRCNAAKSLDEPVGKDNFVAALVELASQQQDQSEVDKTAELEEEESSTRSGSGCFEVQALMKTCGTQCYSSSSQATCAAGCLTGKGVSPGCASCFGRKISCTIKTCLSGCAADPNGAACTSCVASKCGRCNAVKSLDEPVSKDNFVAALVELASQQQDENTILP
eukprot:s1129_g4.t1